MSDSSSAGSADAPRWLMEGRGVAPRAKWRFTPDGPLTSLAYCRESGDLFVADQTGALHRLDRQGRIASLTRVQRPIYRVAWSDDGSQGAIIAGEDLLLRFDRDLKILHRQTLPEIAIGLAVAPFGRQVAVALANGTTVIYDEDQRRLTRFETIRPLAFLEFCSTEPLLFGAAEHGLVCCHRLKGDEVWQQKNWSNVGRMKISGEGDAVYLASFAHGVQALGKDGESIGSYVLDGTVHRADVSFEPQRLVAATIERGLYWLDADGELIWGTRLPDDVVEVVCDPLAGFAIVGMSTAGIARIDWVR